MSSAASRRALPVVFAIVTASLVLCGVAAWLHWKSGPPGPGTALYEEYVDAFQVALGALDADVPQVAEEHLNRAIELVPEEAAGWANRGLLHLRLNRLPEAAADLEQAAQRVPNSPAIQKLLGLLEQRRGNFTAAAGYLRQALAGDPNDVKSLYLLTQVIDQEHQEGSDAESQRLFAQILKILPGNLRVLLDHLKLAMRRSDVSAIQETMARLKELSSGWSERGQKYLGELETSLAGQNQADKLRSLLHFSNVLKGEAEYSRNAIEVSTLDTLPGEPIESFFWLPRIRPSASAPLTESTFVNASAKSLDDGRAESITPVWLTGEDAPVLFVVSGSEFRSLTGDVVSSDIPLSPDGLVAFDWNNDFRTDLLLLGPNGLRFLLQTADGSFENATDKAEIPPDALQAPYSSGMAADVDLDGDLDVLLASEDLPPTFLRNNFDATFTPMPIFPERKGRQAFVWADFNRDGLGDAALLDVTGALHVYLNERSATFRESILAPNPNRYLAIAVADATDDGQLDLIALRGDGEIVALSETDRLGAWDEQRLTKRSASMKDAKPFEARILIADFDNNGAVDLLVSDSRGSEFWLGSGQGRFEPGKAKLPSGLLAAADLKNAGRIDLIGLDAEGHPFSIENAGTGNYHWQTIRPQASKGNVTGDNRINSFGIGGEAELRTGTHIVKVPLTAPVIHLGLGRRTRADVVRLHWPNGTTQFEFKLPIDQTIVAEQRLKGSCPFLFAWNGERFEFVTDFMWSTPLGMYINATNPGGFVQTTDWVKVPGEQLAARDGFYELRVNANLWETHYYDHMTLMAVDHPPETEIFVDERFFMDSAKPAWHLTEPPRSIARALDHLGQDATDDVRAVDGIYLDRAGRGVYQGVTNEHWVEVDLGDEVPTDGPVWLLARGWVHPTDSSVNYAIEQGRHDRPHGLIVEVPDGTGGWKVGRDRLGFPAGKNKTLTIRLDGIDGPGVVRRFRLRTNMEIYWDAIQFARGLDDSIAAQNVLATEVADLQCRGIVAMHQASPGSPELPDYDQVVATGKAWRDLTGYHTRFGDVRELLEKVDDRYAILSSGDEITLRFSVADGPPPGWKRDFVWITDGWVKDGDFNTRFGNTVLPLPAHDQADYNGPVGALEDDPVFRRFPADWDVFHTRFISPHLYRQGLRRHPAPRTSAAGVNR